VADPALGAACPPGGSANPIIVTVRYFAAARAAAGLAEEKLTVPVAEQPTDGGVAACGGITVAAVLAEAADRHGPALANVLRRCSYLLDEVAVHGTGTVMRHGQVLDVLPPFAGG
jgi:sulfur-carrier protein